jgi:hypothetical protein
MENCEKQFGGENCELVNPKPYEIGGGDKVKKVIYVEANIT